MDQIAGYQPTPRTRVRRMPERGHYDRATVHAILDAGLIAHVGYVIDGQPYVTPTAYWREDDRLYWHGSSASRMLRAVAGGIPVCVTVAHFDGLVLARSGFHHSINYRSVVALGQAELVTDREHKLAALRRFMDRIAPRRWDETRPPTEQELKGTSLLWMALDEVSAKVRSGPPKDDAEDMALGCWAGVLPARQVWGAPEPSPDLAAGIAAPAYLADVALG